MNENEDENSKNDAPLNSQSCLSDFSDAFKFQPFSKYVYSSRLVQYNDMSPTLIVDVTLKLIVCRKLCYIGFPYSPFRSV